MSSKAIKWHLNIKSFLPSKLWLSPSVSVQRKTLEAWSLVADPIRYSLPNLKRQSQQDWIVGIWQKFWYSRKLLDATSVGLHDLIYLNIANCDMLFTTIYNNWVISMLQSFWWLMTYADDHQACMMLS